MKHKNLVPKQKYLFSGKDRVAKWPWKRKFWSSFQSMSFPVVASATTLNYFSYHAKHSDPIAMAFMRSSVSDKHSTILQARMLSSSLEPSNAQYVWGFNKFGAARLQGETWICTSLATVIMTQPQKGVLIFLQMQHRMHDKVKGGSENLFDKIVADFVNYNHVCPQTQWNWNFDGYKYRNISTISTNRSLVKNEGRAIPFVRE